MPKPSTTSKRPKSSKPGKPGATPTPQAKSGDLTDRVRLALPEMGAAGMEEKKMFGGTAFMVGGLMCVTARPERILCRIDSESHDEAVAREGCSSMEMKGRIYRGYVLVAAEVLKADRNLKSWLTLALEYNRHLTEEGRPKKPRPSAKKK